MEKDLQRLEEVIREHREALDQLEPTPREKMWAAIQRGPTDRPDPWSFRIGRNWLWAAAASLALLIGLTWWHNAPNGSPDPLPTIATYFPELADEEQSYRRLIQQRENELKLAEIDRHMHQDIFRELRQLESVHQEYLADLPAYQEEEILVKALMKYYEHKLRILERLSHEIQKQEVHENRKRPLYQ